MVGALALALVVASLGLLFVYPAEYVRRLVVWGDADVGDLHRFPARAVPHRAGAGDPPADPQPDRVARAFGAAQPGPSMDAWLSAQGTLAFVVMQHGRVLHEAYHAGQPRDAPVTSFSVAKSVLATLVHALLADGRIASLDQRLVTWLPELNARDARFARITLRQLLNMHSGIAYREFPFFHGDDAKTYYWPDLRALALQHTRIASEPGGAWLYNNYHPLLVGLVVERVGGKPVAVQLGERIWQPAGFGAGASWSLDSERSGFEKLESGLNARALDYARFGQLMLDGGRAADGTQVLPEAMVREMTSPDGALPLDGMRPGLTYQRFWWIQRREGGGHVFSARGNHGQFVFVDPAAGVVIARFGSRYGVPPAQWMRLFERMAEELGRPG